jgi:DNA-binding transcriptional ArsR family regulator
MAGIGKFVGCLSRGFQRSKLAGDSKSRVRRFPIGKPSGLSTTLATVPRNASAGSVSPTPLGQRRSAGARSLRDHGLRSARRGERRRAVANLLDQGLGIAEIARKLGVSKPTVCYHARKLGVPSRREFARRFDWGEISRVYESGVAMRECRRRFGFSSQAWADAVRRVTSRLAPVCFPSTHCSSSDDGRIGPSEGSPACRGLKHNRCEQCGITEWQRKPLSMQLHHVNGMGRTIDSRTSFSSAPTVTADRHVRWAKRAQAAHACGCGRRVIIPAWGGLGPR